MLNKDIHKIFLIKILKAIYSDPDLRNSLGFKGGTAAFLFYNLPRLSVDLDFNLLDLKKKELVFEKLKELLTEFGNLVDATNKRYTLFFLLSYKKGERKVKIEISKRPSKAEFKLKNYLGIPVLLMAKQDMAAGKLSALITRKKFASRDLFDLWFYLKNDWQINEEVLKENSKVNLRQALKKAIEKVKKVKKRHLLQGLGKLLDEKQKFWVKENLPKDLLFYLNLYLKNL